MKNQIEILEKADQIQKKFKSETIDEQEVQESFLESIHGLISAIFGDDADAAYELIESGDLAKYKKRSWKRKLKNFFFSTKFFYITMLLSTVTFLVSEAVTFYAVEGVITTKTYIKAILTELAFIFLSGYVATDRLTKWAVRGLTASVFCLMLFVISAETIKVGVAGVSESNQIAAQIQILESQIDEKEKLIDFYIKKDWPRNATSTRIEKDKLINKLINLKDEQTSGKTNDITEVEQYKSYGKAFFRVILLLINFLITRRLFKF